MRFTGAPMTEISLAEDKDKADWQNYVDGQSFHHHAYNWAWRSVIRETFGHTPKYLIARDAQDQSVSGILPLFHFKSLLFGKALISLPYLNAGGTLADSQEVANSLVERATVEGQNLGVDYVELRHQEANKLIDSPLEARTHKICMVLSLTSDPEELFSSFPAKLRSQTRRPTKSGCYAETFHGSAAGVHDFYTVFSENMRDLGTPVYPKRFFQSIVRHFGKQCRITIVRHEKRPVAAGLTLGQGNHVEMVLASSLRKFSKQSPNMLLYWEAMKNACSDGYQLFDFGRSTPDTGTHKFKQQWGSVETQLYWYYHVVRGSVPDVNPDNPKYRLLVNCWQRLPLPIANCLGPQLTRSLP